MRQIIYKEVKRPGKNHDKLLQMLRDELRGPKHVRRDYIQEVSKQKSSLSNQLTDPSLGLSPKNHATHYYLCLISIPSQVIAEALRFKRRILAQMLENKMEELVAVIQN